MSLPLFGKNIVGEGLRALPSLPLDSHPKQQAVRGPRWEGGPLAVDEV